MKTKTQISFAVTAKLISAFVFATQIVQSLYFLNPKFQASSRLLWLHSPVCVGPGRKPRRPVFSQRGSFSSTTADGLQPVTTVSPDDRRQVRRPRSTQYNPRQLHTGVRDGEVTDGHVPAERHRNDRNYQNYL